MGEVALWLQRHPEAGSSRPSWPKASQFHGAKLIRGTLFFFHSLATNFTTQMLFTGDIKAVV